MKDNHNAVLEEARRSFAQRNTMEMARASGAAFSFYQPVSWREFAVPFLGRVYRVIWPSGEVLIYSSNKPASTAASVIILHYLTNAGGKPPSGKWLPFRQLAGGEPYSQPFQKKTQDPLAEFFGKNANLLSENILDNLKARPGKETHSFLILALPRLPLLLRLEPGTKEIPARASLLFDQTANEYLVIEDLAALGSILASRVRL